MTKASPIGARFRELARANRRALIPFFTAGYPSPEMFPRLIGEAERAGADFIEVGIPFSDPLADGPSIQHSSERALEAGVTLKGTLDMLAERGEETAGHGAARAPIIIMTYVNPVMLFDWRGFAERCAAAGVAGVIIPDLPLEEAAELESETAGAGVDLIYLATPTTGPERLRALGERSGGFLYLVTVTGVTGARRELPRGLADFVGRVRAATALPLCLGFGISTSEQAAEAARLADGIVVGSELVEIIRRHEDTAGGNADGVLEDVSSFLAELRSALDGGTCGGP